MTAMIIRTIYIYIYIYIYNSIQPLRFQPPAKCLFRFPLFSEEGGKDHAKHHGTLHYVFDAVMPFLQVSTKLGTITEAEIRMWRFKILCKDAEATSNENA